MMIINDTRNLMLIIIIMIMIHRSMSRRKKWCIPVSEYSCHEDHRHHHFPCLMFIFQSLERMIAINDFWVTYSRNCDLVVENIPGVSINIFKGTTSDVFVNKPDTCHLHQHILSVIKIRNANDVHIESTPIVDNTSHERSCQYYSSLWLTDFTTN
jgi:hypothetical protein